MTLPPGYSLEWDMTIPEESASRVTARSSPCAAVPHRTHHTAMIARTEQDASRHTRTVAAPRGVSSAQQSRLMAECSLPGQRPVRVPSFAHAVTSRTHTLCSCSSALPRVSRQCDGVYDYGCSRSFQLPIGVGWVANPLSGERIAHQRCSLSASMGYVLGKDQNFSCTSCVLLVYFFCTRLRNVK